MKKIIFISVIFLSGLILSFNMAWALEAPGNIYLEKNGNIYSIQPDGRGEKKIIENAGGPVLISPDGKKIAFLRNDKIFLYKDAKIAKKPIYTGKPQQKINLCAWKAKMGGFYFRLFHDDGSLTYMFYDEEKDETKSLGVFQEPPVFSNDGNYWVYSTYTPKGGKSEVYGGRPGEKGQYIFDGRMKQVLTWGREGDLLFYCLSDKIFGYDIESRARQPLGLPFKDVRVVSFTYPIILFSHINWEEKPGLQMYDPELNEQKEIIEEKKTFIEVTHNRELEKAVIFIPTKPGNFMGEGELYLVETREGKSQKLTRDYGRRVLMEINMDNQWSPDGKYFVYEKLKMKYTDIKKSEIFIAGGGKDEKFVKQAGHPVWGAQK